MNNIRTAEALRPKSFDEIVGQKHLFGERGVVRKMLASGRITNMIFYGPPGTGKTTAAEIIARESNMVFHRLNATTASISDVKDILSSTNNIFSTGGILLYIDEIQYFNKKQQQALLEYIEDGRVTLITSTTENPHFYIYNAIISRSSLFEFKPVAPEDCAVAVRRAVDYLNSQMGEKKSIDDSTVDYIARSTSGDVRHAIVLTENAFFAADDAITKETVDNFNVRVGNFDDDTHYDLLSCLQKSIRGSDADAAVFYLAKLLSLGELISVCRRLQVIASEDIGLAYPQAAVVTRACCESAKELGMPEAAIPLANATVLLATSPKSNSAHDAVFAAMADVEKGYGREVPTHLKSPLFKGYKYPHEYPNHYVRQQYLPDDVKDRRYYEWGSNKLEDAARQYWEKIKK
ncbi:MAG: replication-associated recombination protein A [Clostridia bacterium]|nr:replication-associated recombination protein A [Clostridia bacterium]MBR4014389.1 replication-associated recombination protein A [Clostridia bacterium]